MKTVRGMDIQECYRILKVEQGADWPDVKKSFHTLAREYHPDRNAGNRAYEEKFKEISRAYETLERWTRSQPFAYRVYSQAVPVKDRVSLSINGGLKPFDFLPDGVNKYLSRWTGRVWLWLQRYERKWLELDVEKAVTIDPVTASQGGTLKVKNPAGSFHVQVPREASNETVLRIPGKGEIGLFNREPGDLLLKIKVDPGRKRPPGVSEFFYHVKFVQDQLQNPQVRTLETHEGSIQYILPKKVRAGQSFVLKSQPHPQTGKVSHHILVIDLI